MEALEELMGDAHIIKGKRTKRQRLQSPIPFSIATYDSPGGQGENACSPAELAESVTTEEDEEDVVANCLILLAQGSSAEAKSSKPGNCRDDHGITTGFRYTSKRFLEAPSTGSGKVGMFVYQCKTCDRTFPSFQALGGHRASHKRPKPAPVEVKRKAILLTDEGEGEEEEGGGEGEGEIKDHASPSLSLQLLNRPNGNQKSSPKVHECSVCGAEFVSGQALGGHMRRHRISRGTNTTLSLSPIGCEYEEDREAKKQRSSVSSLGPLSQIRCGSEEDQEAKKQRIVLSLDLDLNLPAPLEDQVGESQFAFASKEQPQQQQQQQQSSLLLSTGPALVDCQY